MTARNFLLQLLVAIAVALTAGVAARAAQGGPGGTGGATTNQVFDTSAAVEASYACLSGGCHETNATLVNDYSASAMTHVMVKCNACHGTHTAAELGLPKPNLTGYYAGIGAVGYRIPKDRCLACHGAVLNRGGHPSNPSECLSCHGPHVFPARQ